MTVTDYAMSDFHDTSTSETWVNVTDGHLNFTTSATGCVMITFSGPDFVFPSAGVYEGLRVRTLLDGNNLCAPPFADDTFLSSEGPAPEAASSITRICRGVSPGTHTLQAQYRSNSGEEVDLYSHVLTVTHN
jgi:hypothetical protein